MGGRKRMSEISGSKIVIKDLFGDKYYFNIPEYQRPYSWQKEHCQQLFDDISQADRDREYFLGTVILQKIDTIGTISRYDVIDGQQRLTTIQILLACLRDCVEDGDFKNSIQQKIYQKENKADGIPERVRLEAKEKNFLKVYVQENQSTKKVMNNTKIVGDNEAQKNIINAIQIFYKNIQTMKQGEIQSLISYISQKCIFIHVITENFDDAYRLFTIINDRGLQLRRIDILKTSNLDPSVIPDENIRKEYARKWEDMEDDLGSDEFEKLIYFIRSINIREKAKEDILKEYSKLLFAKGTLKKGVEFIDYIEEYKKIYQDLIIDNNIKLQANEIAFKNLIQLMVDFFPSNEWIPALMYYYKRFGEVNIYEFLVKLEIKVVADWIIALTPAKRTVNINNILKKINSAKNSIDIINSDEMKYDEQQYMQEIAGDIYGKRHDKYILMKLEYLESEQNVVRKYGTISVEHVLPQNPKDDSQWKKDFSDADRVLYTNKICNLVLLSKKKNSSASNYDFEDKKKKYLEGRITDLGRSQKILSESSWNPKVLNKRQEKIMDILKKNGQ